MSICRAYNCSAKASEKVGRYSYCGYCAPRIKAKHLIAERTRRTDEAFETRWNAAKARSPEWGFLADLAANAEVWTREEYERFCKSWHHEFQSHAEGHEPSRARARRNGGKGRTVLLP